MKILSFCITNFFAMQILNWEYYPIILEGCALVGFNIFFYILHNDCIFRGDSSCEDSYDT